MGEAKRNIEGKGKKKTTLDSRTVERAQSLIIPLLFDCRQVDELLKAENKRLSVYTLVQVHSAKKSTAYCTHNENVCSALYGYLCGEHIIQSDEN